MNTETNQKSFDVMKWLRETRERIYEETRDMTWEERMRWYARRPTDPLLAKLHDKARPPRGGTTRAERKGTVALAVPDRLPSNAKLRVYVETSVFRGCEDDEYGAPSRRLFEQCASGEITLVVSWVTLQELEGAPQAVRDVLDGLHDDHLEVIERTGEIAALADQYVASGVLSRTMLDDARHVAAATVAGVDAVVSWNFRHMVNLSRIRKYGEVNRRMGYGPVDMRSPRELEK